jgi:CRP/FNR family transcriptional regulator, cyclic AMP receptor protein
MLKRILGVREPSAAAATDSTKQREIESFDAELLTGFLCDAKCITPMTKSETRIAISYMRSRQYADGEVILREGDKSNTSHMLWILHGEALVETLTSSKSNPITVTVLSPGSTLGELSLMDGGTRSVTCSAAGNTRCAILTKLMLQNMLQDHPEVASKLISIIFISVANRLRDLTEKFKRYALLNDSMAEELRDSNIANNFS